MKILNNFIDELGMASPNATQSSIYVLSSIILPSYARDDLKIKADQIKFKYWGRTNICFHSREIGRREGDFVFLKDSEKYSNFTKDLMQFLHQGNFHLFGVVVDKSKIPSNWNEKTIYKKTAQIVVQNYIFALLAQNCRGRLIVESATAEKDFYYHKVAGHFLAQGFPDLGITHTQVQDALTEISFVTKKNHDIEEQLADLLAYGLKVKYKYSGKKHPLDLYEQNILSVVNKKLFVAPTGTSQKKQKYYSRIKGFTTLP